MTKHKISWFFSALIMMLLSAVLFVSVIPSAWSYIEMLSEDGRHIHDWWLWNQLSESIIKALSIITSGICAMCAIGSVIIKKGKPSTFIAISFLMQAVFIFSYINLVYGFEIGEITAMLVGVLTMLSLMLMATMCYIGENGGKLTKFRFAPAILFTVVILIVFLYGSFVTVGEALEYDDDFIFVMIESIPAFLMVALIGVAYILPMSFAGFALGDKKLKTKNKVPAVDASVQPKPISSAPVQKMQERKTDEDADVLRKYKQLYDEGVITEEEFAQKKKQIMNL